MKLSGFMAAAALACGLIGGASATPAPPSTVNWQGVVKDGGALFNGTGQFKFALVDGGGDTVWSNDGTMGTPAAPVPLPVANGVAAVALGSATLHMPPINAAVLTQTDLRLRVWFSRDGAVYEPLSPDQPLASAPFAQVAATSVQADSATSAANATHASDASTVSGKSPSDFAPATYHSGIISGLGAGYHMVWTITGATLPTQPYLAAPFKSEVDVVEVRQVTQNGQTVIVKTPGTAKTGSLTLRRIITSNTDWSMWYNSTVARGISTNTKTVTLSLTTAKGAEIVKWTFPNAWPSGYMQRLTDDGLLVEELTLEPDSFTRTDAAAPPVGQPLVRPFTGQVSGLPASDSIAPIYAGATYKSFVVASDFGASTAVVTVKQTGSNGAPVYVKTQGTTDFADLTLCENPTAEPLLVKMYTQVLGGQIAQVRQPLALKLGDAKVVLATYNLTNTWPSSYTLFMGDDGLPVERFNVVSEGFTRS